MARGKPLLWESVRADVCRHYLDGKPLLEVQSIMLREQGFKASIRAYRTKLRDWGAKRIDTRQSSSPSWYDAPLFPSSSLREGAHANNNTESVASQVDNLFHVLGEGPEIVGDLPAAIQHEHQQQTLSSATKFEEVLRRIRESPSTDPCTTILCKDDFKSADSTLMHYVAARGYMGEVLKEVLKSGKHHGYSVDALDQSRSTPLQVAIRHHRYENVVALLDFGASVTSAGSDGELPLHMAITSCGEARMVKEIHSRYKDGARVRVQSPSQREGQVALDLVVNRLLREVPELGEAVCTQETKRIFFEIVKTTPTIESTMYLQRHADDNWVLFLQAMTAVGRLPYCHKLRDTMSQVAYEPENINEWHWYRFINQDLLQGHLT